MPLVLLLAVVVVAVAADDQGIPEMSEKEKGHDESKVQTESGLEPG